jgi:hypothetical protein
MARQSALGDMEKFAMNAVSILGAAAWAGLVTLVLGMQTALAEPLVYVPLGGEGKIVVVDAAKDEVVDTISGVTAVHGLAGTPDGQFLSAGSFEKREAGNDTVSAIDATRWIVEQNIILDRRSALATFKVDLEPVQVGQRIIVRWRGGALCIDHRAPERIAQAKADDLVDLKDRRWTIQPTQSANQWPPSVSCPPRLSLI